ncbi:MAG: DNA gyrase/topoisomerase IV subunit A, partial [Bacteroidales bacterium]|nr:DNA gyrase/topoisomerase IV subunit A [Bacteroidales bacterium]
MSLDDEKDFNENDGIVEGDEEMIDEEVIEGEEVMSSAPAGKYDRLLGDNSRKFKLSGMFKDWFLDYSSYVILYRAVPHITDGLKPVQRRVLHAMYRMDDGSLTKAANIVGQAMQFHPHGDASILGALVQLGQKDLLIDCQGNWGNILTGDSNAAARYIEARLSKFAKEVVFNPKITNWMTSYDGRNQEPVELPVRFPLLLAQGAEGIAVGLASKILPHNFNELIDASIKILRDEPFELYPDFPTGGFADCSKYNKGRRGGVLKVRARIEKIDKNTIAITELPFGRTTHALCESILKARDKGKIKIRKLDDLTTSTAKIVIHLPNDVSPDKTIDALYAFTDCEISISPNACVIADGKPQFLDVDEILRYSTFHTRDLLGRELEIRLGELENDWHYNSLEKIFFENKVYKLLEADSASWEEQLDAVLAEMRKYQSLFKREIVMDDILKLVEKPVRKISKFDTKAVDEKIRSIEAEMERVRYDLEHLTEFTIRHFENIGKKYGGRFVRQTEITNFENITATRVVNNNAKLYANKAEGFVGIALKKEDNGEFICECSDLSEIIVFNKDGKYRVAKVSSKAFFGPEIIYVGVFDRNDTRTIYNVIYKDGKGGPTFAKRFAVGGITRDKEYDLTQGKEGSRVVWFTANGNGEAETVKIYLRPKPKLKKLVQEYDFSTLAIKGRSSRGNLVTKNLIQRIQLKAKGVSTLGGKDIWFDADIQRLNEDGRGLYLGQFNAEDHVLAVFKNGTYYTTTFDLSSRYQGELLRIERLEPGKVFTALYYDGEAGAFYVKRFEFEVNDNTPVSFISDGKGSYLVDISDEPYPQVELTFCGKNEHRAPETIDAESFIAKKGIAAKGKKVSPYEVATVSFAEPA